MNEFYKNIILAKKAQQRNMFKILSRSKFNVIRTLGVLFALWHVWQVLLIFFFLCLLRCCNFMCIYDCEVAFPSEMDYVLLPWYLSHNVFRLFEEKQFPERERERELTWSQHLSEMVSASAANQPSILHKYHCNTLWDIPSNLHNKDLFRYPCFLTR